MSSAPAVLLAARPFPARAAARSVARPERRFPLLDSVRAIAALSILVYHASEGGLRFDPWLAMLTMRLNQVGIPLFMVLSAYLLYRPFVAASLAGRIPSVGRYLLGRALRIAPAYWACLAVLAFGGWLPGQVFGPRWWVYFGFVQTYFDWTSLNGLATAWTLCLEVAFYVFLAFWAFAFGTRRPSLARDLIVLLALSLASLAVLASYRVAEARLGNLELTLPANFFMFGTGMALAAVSVRVEATERGMRLLRALSRRSWAAWVAAAGVYAYMCMWAGLPPRGVAIQEYTVGSWLLEPLLGMSVSVLLVAPAILPPAGTRGTNPVTALLSSPVLLYLGRISYGIYLWHIGFVAWVNIAIPQSHTYTSIAFDIAIVLALSVLFAAASWEIVERPFLRLKDWGRASAAAEEEWRDNEGAAARDQRRERPAAGEGIGGHGGAGGLGGGDRHRPAGGGASQAWQRPAGPAPAAGAVDVHQAAGAPAPYDEVAVRRPARPGSLDHLEQAAVVRHHHAATGGREAGGDGGDAGDREADVV